MTTKCARCGKELHGSVYCVAGENGEFGFQCALEICQGRRIVKRRLPSKAQTLTESEIIKMGGLPF